MAETPDAPRSERGVRSIANTVVNRVVTLFVNAATGIITARALMPAGRGELAAMILWPLLLSFITTLGIPSALIYVLKQKRIAAGEGIATGFAMILGLTITAAVAGAQLLPLWLGRQYAPGVVHTAQFFLVMMPVLALTQAGRVVLEAHSLFTRSNRILLVAPVTTLAGLLGLLAAHALTPFAAGLAYMAGAVPAFLLMLWWLLPFVREGGRITLVAARALLSYGVRSFGIDLLGTLALQVDQVLVISLLPPAAMGSYGVVLSLSRMFNLFQASVVVVLFPKAAGGSPEHVLGLTERSARISTIVTAACCLVVAVFGSTVLRLLYGGAYAANTAALQLLLLEVTISGAVFILAQAFMALGHPGIVTALQGLGLALSVPLMLWLIPALGVEGAALSLLLSTLARFVFVYLGFRLILKTRLPRLLPTRDDVRLVVQTVHGIVQRAAPSAP